jgi:hypothetical protein
MERTRMASAKLYATRFINSPEIMITIPLHHNGLFKYGCPSPATCPSFFAHASNPFFLRMKEDPMSRPLATASVTPIAL